MEGLFSMRASFKTLFISKRVDEQDFVGMMWVTFVNLCGSVRPGIRSRIKLFVTTVERDFGL